MGCGHVGYCGLDELWVARAVRQTVLSLVGLLLLLVVVHGMSLKVAARDQGVLCVWNAPG